MKNIQTFEEFVNESNELNEMPMNRRYDDGQYSILSMGSLNIKTGECKHFNVYKTFDGTAEIYKDSTDKFKIVFTAGSSPIKNRDKSDLKAGDRRAFKDDQRGTPLFVGSFVESCRVNQLQDVAAKLSIKSCIGYTYK
jgi:hypothetical protein